MTTPPKTAPDSTGQLEIDLGTRLETAMKKLGQTIHQRSQQRKAQQQEREQLQSSQHQEESQIGNCIQPAQEPPQVEQTKVVLLAPWAEDKRAAPNAVFRSALFPALNNKLGRKFVKEQKIYSVGAVEVSFTGEQFDQTDLDVYLEILNFAKGTPLGQPVRFSAYAMLKALGRATGSANHKWLHAVLVRLRGGTVELVTSKVRFFGGLIEGGFKNEISKHYEIILNPNYAVLFGFGLWSAINLEQRRALSRNSTAKALHAYYSTHAAPGLHRYETLAGIVGLDNKNRRELKASLIRAHEELKRVGFLLDYEAKENGIKVKVIMTPGQQRHVIKEMTKASKKPSI